jgi:hypothetical protein
VFLCLHRKHEWEKHGTCAAQVDALNSEKKYFGTSLDLYKQVNLNRWVHPSLQVLEVSQQTLGPTAAPVFWCSDRGVGLIPRKGSSPYGAFLVIADYDHTG